ncbi:hypothetical protein [Lacinutrix chionoecetis]
MKYRLIVVKVLLLLVILLNFSCDSDDECDESLVTVEFAVKIKLVSTSGDNLLNDDDFDLALLKITDPTNSNLERSFSQLEENGVALIVFDALNMDSVNFEYDDENEFYFGFDDIKTQSIGCIVVVTNYKARKLNGDLICDCNVIEPLTVTLDL